MEVRVLIHLLVEELHLSQADALYLLGKMHLTQEVYQYCAPLSLRIP